MLNSEGNSGLPENREGFASEVGEESHEHIATPLIFRRIFVRLVAARFNQLVRFLFTVFWICPNRTILWKWNNRITLSVSRQTL